jgi:hypothetical protein
MVVVAVPAPWLTMQAGCVTTPGGVLGFGLGSPTMQIISAVENPVPVNVTSIPAGPCVGISVIDGAPRTGVKRLNGAVIPMKADRINSNVTRTLSRRSLKFEHTSLNTFD